MWATSSAIQVSRLVSLSYLLNQAAILCEATELVFFSAIVHVHSI